MVNFDAFSKIESYFEVSDNYFLNQQEQVFKKFKPLQGIKILHNIPLTLETVKKLSTLAHSGADITVSALSFIKPNNEALNILDQANFKVELDHTNIKDDFDILLDCCAEFHEVITPRIGSVELTKTGINMINKSKVSVPIIDIDSSRTKELETVLGTGEAFIRAIKEQTSLTHFENKHFILFGYGKVGKGIAYQLLKHKADLTVVETNSQSLEAAKKSNIKTIHSSKVDSVHEIVDKAFCIVTATGINNVISDNFDKKFFLGKILANMGAGDEFGTDYNIDDCLCDKEPINFSLDKPTLMHYLDPIFYLHNEAAVMLKRQKFSNGISYINDGFDNLVLNNWERVYNEKLI